jgi:GNAT superfamily N-acetyltransferase
MSYAIEKADLGEHKNILCKLWQRNFEGVPNKRFDWMYGNNPLGEPVVFLLKLEQSQIVVGALSLFPHTILVAGRQTTGYICGDIAVDHAHRALGPAVTLLKAAIQHCEENAPCVLLTTPNQKSKPVASRVGFHRLGTYFAMTKVLRTGKYIRNHIQSTIAADSLAFLADRTAGLYYKSRSFRFSRGYQATLVEDFGAGFNTFMQNRAKHLFLAGYRTVPFLNWRLKESPYGANQFFVLKKDDVICGYISFTMRNNRCDIEDFAFDEKRQCLKALLDAFTLFQLKNGIEAISIHLAGQKALVEEFARARFFIRGEESQFMFYAAPEELKQSLMPPAEMWYLTTADNDV